MKKIILPFALSLVIGLLVSGCGALTKNATPTPTVAPSNTIVAEGHLVPSRNQTLAFAARGKIQTLAVKQGDSVKAGQVLASLADRQPAQAALSAAQLALASAQQDFDRLTRTSGLGLAQAWQDWLKAQTTRENAQLAWDKLDQSGIQTNIDTARSDVTSRKTDLDNAQTDFDKYKDLAIDNATRKSYESKLRTAQTNYDQAVQKWEQLINNRDQVQAALNAAQAAEAEAQRTYQISQNGPNTDKLALAQAALENARAQVAAAQDALSNYDLTAQIGRAHV